MGRWQGENVLWSSGRKDLPGPGPVKVLLFGALGLEFQGVVVVTVSDKVRYVRAHKRQNPQLGPLQDVGQFVGQEWFGEGYPPADEDDPAPDLGPGPPGDEPGDPDDPDGAQGGSGGQSSLSHLA